MRCNASRGTLQHKSSLATSLKASLSPAFRFLLRRCLCLATIARFAPFVAPIPPPPPPPRPIYALARYRSRRPRKVCGAGILTMRCRLNSAPGTIAFSTNLKKHILSSNCSIWWGLIKRTTAYRKICSSIKILHYRIVPSWMSSDVLHIQITFLQKWAVVFVYNKVPAFEIQADIFMSLESIWRAFRRVKYGETSKNISLYFKRKHLMIYLLSNHKSWRRGE